MDKTLLFFVTLMVIIWTTSAQNSNCNRTTCTTIADCNGPKCDDIDGTCMPYDHAINPKYCPNGYRNGWGQWCKWHKKCKCCYYPVCRLGCVYGNCTLTDHCKCYPWAYGPQCQYIYLCDPACQNGSTCIGPNECECQDGWEGAICDEPICNPECQKGTCIGPNECKCQDGWEGAICDEPICNPACQNGGLCIGPNECECLDGWEGAVCDVPICNPACQNGICIGPNECECLDGWEGAICDVPICDPACQNGFCIGPNECECLDGWEGAVCDVPICDPVCENGGTCIGPNECECQDGWEGAICDEPICNPACQNGGTCTGPNECTCTPDYHGEVCQYIECSERELCIGKSGTCYAKIHPILTNTTACPQTDNGRKWCTPMCACCFGA